MTHTILPEGIPDRLYGRRRGHPLRPRQERLLDLALPRFRLTAAEAAHPQVIFPGAEALWLEIGFGGGEHLAAQAEANPDVGFIGCEPFLNGVASLIRHAERRGLENIRILADDARQLLPFLPDGSIGRIFVLFGDPWPKRRHHGRRIVQHETVAEFHRLLRPGGELRLASDDMPYLRWMLARATAHPGFRWLVDRPADWRERGRDWPQTRYEAKALAEGRQPAFLRFRRI